MVKTKKLINIARPLELPPLKLASDSPVTDAKKKPTLPLFGKKRTFGFGKPAPKAIKIVNSAQQKDVEEFDDDEDDLEGGSNIARESTSEKDVKINEKDEVSKRPSSPEELKRKVKGSEIDVPVHSSTNKILTDESDEKCATNANAEVISDAHESVESTASCKRKRNRYRNRSEKGRGNIDIDDIEEPLESEKYSKWVPPQNQSGDGITDLNSKYGY